MGDFYMAANQLLIWNYWKNKQILWRLYIHISTFVIMHMGSVPDTLDQLHQSNTILCSEIETHLQEFEDEDYWHKPFKNSKFHFILKAAIQKITPTTEITFFLLSFYCSGSPMPYESVNVTNLCRSNQNKQGNLNLT